VHSSTLFDIVLISNPYILTCFTNTSTVLRLRTQWLGDGDGVLPCSSWRISYWLWVFTRDSRMLRAS